MIKIPVPGLSTTNAIDFSSSLPLCSYDTEYLFDFSDVKNYESFPMLFTALVIRQFCQNRSVLPFNLKISHNNDDNFSYACHMGFFRAAGFSEGKLPGESFGSTSYIPLTKINLIELLKENANKGVCLEEEDVIELEAKRLSEVISQSEREIQKLLQYLIREALRNIPEHAETSELWICGQYWPNKDLAEIAILDEGIGVLNSLKKNEIHSNYISNDEEALRWALKPGVSSSFDPARGQKEQGVWANSGYGLYMISEICKFMDGWFTFVSGNKCIRVYPDNLCVYQANFRGTALGIRLKPSKIIEFQSIIDTARKRGEETAKDIKNSFKKASIPSKGLIY